MFTPPKHQVPTFVYPGARACRIRIRDTNDFNHSILSSPFYENEIYKEWKWYAFKEKEKYVIKFFKLVFGICEKRHSRNN
jgi:hypothetical protein